MPVDYLCHTCNERRSTHGPSRHDRPVRCAQCKLPDDLFIYRDRICERCEKVKATYRKPGETNATVCRNCKEPDYERHCSTVCRMCNVSTKTHGPCGSPAQRCERCSLSTDVPRKMKVCKECGRKLATHGIVGNKASICADCSAHVPNCEPKNIGRCEVCNVNAATHGTGKRASRCKVCRNPDDTRYVSNGLLCSHEGCFWKSTHSMSHSDSPMWCARHAPVESKNHGAKFICITCKRHEATHGFENGMAQHCSGCYLEGEFYLGFRRCTICERNFSSCKTLTQKLGSVCFNCKTDDMTFNAYRVCTECRILPPTHASPMNTGDPQRCFRCKQEGDVIYRRSFPSRKHIRWDHTSVRGTDPTEPNIITHNQTDQDRDVSVTRDDDEETMTEYLSPSPAPVDAVGEESFDDEYDHVDENDEEDEECRPPSPKRLCVAEISNEGVPVPSSTHSPPITFRENGHGGYPTVVENTHSSPGQDSFPGHVSIHEHEEELQRELDEEFEREERKEQEEHEEAVMHTVPVSTSHPEPHNQEPIPTMQVRLELRDAIPFLTKMYANTTIPTGFILDLTLPIPNHSVQQNNK